MSGSSESKELDLVGKVEMRIALAKDDKLEGLLKTYLAPLLLKLASERPAVRNKVVSTCQHIKVRLAGNQEIVLPVVTLLKQYKDNPGSTMVRHFDLMFIQQSVGKLSSQEQMDILPILLHGLEKDSGKPTCATLFKLFLRLLPSLKIPTRGSNEDKELRQRLDLVDRPEDARFVASWFGKLVLLSIVKPAVSGVTCPGLTVQEYEFLTLTGKEEAWDPNAVEGLNLTLTKINVLSFLASGAFTDEERFLPALFASGDSNSRISSLGDEMLKRSTISLEEHKTVEHLFRIYFTVKPALQTRLLNLLAKSAASTSYTREIVRIVEEGIRPHDNTNLPAKGLETVKFRNALFNYMNWVSRIGSEDNLAQIAPALVSLLRHYIEDQGWPIPHEKSTDSMALRALAYETLGSLAKTTPSIVLEDDLSLVRWLFRSLTEEGSSDSIFVSIDGAVASLLHAFITPLPSKLKEELRLLLLKYMTLEEGDDIVRSARFAAVRWANRCLDYNDIVARWIDILALSGRTDERSDVIEEGKKGLDPYWYRLLNALNPSAQSSLPDWAKMIEVFFTSRSLVENASIANSMKTGMEVDSISVFGNFSGNRINAYAPSIAYCRRILLLEALEKTPTPLDVDADWERQLNVLFRSDKSSRAAMKTHIDFIDEDALQLYLTAAFEGMLRNEGNGLGECGKCFTDIVSLAPTKALGHLAKRAFELLPAIRSNTQATRLLAAQAFGMLAAHPAAGEELSRKAKDSLLNDIQHWSSAVGADANQVHGSILALGSLVSHLPLYGRLDTFNHDEIKDAILQLLAILKGATDSFLRSAVFHALGSLGATEVLTLDHIEASSLQVKGLIDILTLEGKKGDEKAIACLGRLAVVFDDDFAGNKDGPLKNTIDSLYGLFELKQVEVHFTIGEALGCAVACWQSDALLLGLDIDTAYGGRQKRAVTLKSLLDRLLEDCKTTKPSLKKATGIWLFSLIQYCGHLTEVQARLRECQGAFMGLLSARDELVQETASRGLSLVYEQGDAELKERLVKDLVASFTGTSTQLKVDEETELFEPGALPTGEGNSVTSYKDIISLANEVGDQSLVYKFMSLAANAATWSTRSAFGRFGLSNILSQGEIDPKLYPKLYRYRFDPNTNVRRSMNDIWNALVKDSSAIINQYFDEILADLLKSILGKEWRTREASCAAIADLVQGREFETYEKHLHDIWQVAFKVMDDIKGSVRKAAMSLSMALTGILVRQVEAGTESKHAQAMLKEVLPFLLSGQGLESSAKDVRAFATITVLKIIKSGGKVILPFVPTLVEQLLGLLSTLEMEGLDYVYLNAAKYGIKEDKIDSARSSAVSQSPLMEAIERCLDVLDEPTMAELVPHLQNVIKTAVGMPSKIGCSGILVSLATRHSFVFRPHADFFLKTIEKCVLDRNNAVSAAYSRSAGYLARLASDKAVLRLATYSKDLYLNAEDESRRQIAADIIYAVSKYGTDRFNAFASVFLPFVFFAKHDFDEHVKEQFEKTWSENVGGSRAVLLYLKEITELCVEKLKSPKWTIKHTAALAIADTASSAGNEISSANASVIWSALEKALALKTFDGKEKVLDAIIKFTQNAKSYWENETGVADSMKKIAVREAKRNNDVYRPYAWACLGKFCEARADLDMFEEVYGVISPLSETLIGEDAMDIDDDAEGKKSGKDNEAETITAGVEALFKAANTKLSTEPHLKKLLDFSRMVVKSSKTVVATRTAFYERLKVLFDGLRENKNARSVTEEILVGFFELLDVPSGSGTEAMRTKRAEAAEAVASMADETSVSPEVKAVWKGVVVEGRRNERSQTVQKVLDRVMKLV